MKILPVIHHLNFETSIGQAMLARRCGADGVFLISHAGEDAEIIEVATQIKSLVSRMYVGINLLSTSPVLACIKAAENSLDMVWADYMGVSSREVTPLGEELSKFARANPSIELLASVAFKYQPADFNPPLAALNARDLRFIPTTSGAATGSAPELSKIQAMSQATKGILGIASGMTPDNIAQFAPHLSHVLVATGVSEDEHHLSESLLESFIQRAREAGTCTQ